MSDHFLEELNYDIAAEEYTRVMNLEISDICDRLQKFREEHGVSIVLSLNNKNDGSMTVHTTMDENGNEYKVSYDVRVNIKVMGGRLF